MSEEKKLWAYYCGSYSDRLSVFSILLAIGGAIVGGYLGQLLGFYRPGESVGFLMAVIGSITLLELYAVLIRRRL